MADRKLGVLEMGGIVRPRAAGEGHSEFLGLPGERARQVETVRLAVDIERGPGPGRRREDRFVVEGVAGESPPTRRPVGWPMRVR